MNKRQNLTSTQGFLFFGQFKQQQIFVFLWPAWFQNVKKKKKRRRKEGKREREKREVIIWYGTDTGWSLYYFTDIKNNSCYCYLFSPYKQTLRQEWIFSECQKGQVANLIAILPGSLVFLISTYMSDNMSMSHMWKVQENKSPQPARPKAPFLLPHYRLAFASDDVQSSWNQTVFPLAFCATKYG